MSTVYSQASIIVPQSAGYQADILHAWNPQTSSLVDFDVVRNTTATRVNESGLIESVAANVPRIDWPIGGGCPSLLVEPQRTNLLQRSEEFDNAYWTKNNATVTANDAVAPDGYANADKLVENTNNTYHGLRATITSSINPFSFSVFAKSFSGNRYLQLRMANDISGSISALFDLDIGTIIVDTTLYGGGYSVSPSKIISLGNGWYKCTVSGNKTDNVGNNNIEINLSSTISGTEVDPYTGDGTSGLFIWGAQLEEGSNATSYIPTTSAAVTRNADVISKTGISSLIGQSEGTLFVDAKVDFNVTGVFCLHENTANDSRLLINISSESNLIQFFLQKSGLVEVNSVFSIPSLSDSFFKIAFVYNENNCSFFVNGVKVGADTNAETFSGTTLSRISFSNATGSTPFFGKVKSMALLPSAITEAEAIALTTL